MAPSVVGELEELQNCGLKVIFPSAGIPQVSPSYETAPHVSVAVDSQPLEFYDIDILRDWVDLADLDGMPSWPQGVTCNDVKYELSRRSRQGFQR